MPYGSLSSGSLPTLPAAGPPTTNDNLAPHSRSVDQCRLLPQRASHRFPVNVAVTPSCPRGLRSPTSWSLSDFRLLKVVGEGQRAVVYHAEHRQSRTPVALKVYAKHMLSVVTRRQVDREIAIQGRLAHTNIVKLYGAFEDGEHVVLIEEYGAWGDLFRRVSRRGPLTEAALVQTVMVPVLLALDHLHAQGILFRDLKPENVLLAAGSAKLTDFGAAIDLRSERAVSRLGTLAYMSPEVLCAPDEAHIEQHAERAASYGYQADVWALGAMAYELLLGASPFSGPSQSAMIKGIMEEEVTVPPGRMSPAAEDFIRSCLQKDPRSRPSTADLLQHPWMQGAQGSSSRPVDAHDEPTQDNCSRCTEAPELPTKAGPSGVLWHKAARASKVAAGAPASREGRPARMSSANRKHQAPPATAPASAFRD